MKRTIIFGLMLTLLAASAVFAGQTTVVKVKVEVANVRAEPDASSPIVKQVPKGTLLEANSRVGVWFEVTILDDSGASISAYIHSRIVDVVGEDAPVQETRVQPRVAPQRQPARQAPAAYPSYPRSPGKLRALGGLAMASVTYSEDGSAQAGASIDDYKKSKMGLLGGIGYEFGGQMGVEIDFLYMQKGVKFAGIYNTNGAGTGVDFDVKVKLDVVTIPVLFKFKLAPGSTPYLLAGGEIGYILSSKLDYDAVNLETDEIYTGTEDLKDQENMNSIDYGLVLGAGYELIGGPVPLSIEARYHMGLANLIKYDDTLSGSVQSSDYVKTNALVLLLGFRF
jgi:outer membrane protein with beta-barrel domain/SH3 domain-containing protein